MSEEILSVAALKKRKLERDIKQGLVLAEPLCEDCGWKGDSPAVFGAGCPQCGARIVTDAAPGAFHGKAKGKKAEAAKE